MKQRMKQILKEVDKEALRRECKRDEDGRIIIPMSVSDDSDFLSVFSESDTPLIGSDVAEYLERKAEDIPLDEPLVLQIRSNCIDPYEQECYRKGVREYYFVQYLSCKAELRRNLLLGVTLVVGGLLLLLLCYWIDGRFGSAYWSEVADIMAWVFLWEATAVFTMESFGLRRLRRRCLNFMEMEIKFTAFQTK